MGIAINMPRAGGDTAVHQRIIDLNASRQSIE
jgi:hypothetical protein